MPKEAKDTRDDNEKKSGGSGGDGLDDAAEKISRERDIDLASSFHQANQDAMEDGIVSDRELFASEQNPSFSFEEHEPDKILLKDIYDSLANKDIHHKKLLDEGSPSNFFMAMIHAIKKFFVSEETTRKKIVRAELTPYDWKQVSEFNRFRRKHSALYFGDFGSLLDLWLRDKERTRLIFKYELISLTLVSIISSVILFFFSRYHLTVSADKFRFSSQWSNFIFAISLISLLVSITPVFFFMSLWFANINYLHTSKNFHFFLLFSLTVSLGFAILAAFNAGLYHLIDWRFAINVAPKQTGTGAEAQK